MGKESQEELKLRQVNIETNIVSAVSEFMNTTGMSLDYIDKTTQGIETPVMEKMKQREFKIPDTAPSEDDVIQAHKDVGLELAKNSYKHPKRVSRAAEKREEQRKLTQKREDYNKKLSGAPARSDEQKAKDSQQAFEFFQELDLSTLMFDKSGKNVFDKLFKNFDKIRTVMSKIPDFEHAINEKLAKLGNQKPDEEIIKAQAKLKTLYDIRAYYDIAENIMKNKYYSLLPRDKMQALSYTELRIRLAKLYEADAAKRNVELIDYYQSFIRLHQISLSDSKSVQARQEEYQTALTPKTVTKENKDANEIIQSIADHYADLLDYYQNDENLLTKENFNIYKQRFFESFNTLINKYIKTATKKDKKIETLRKQYEDYNNGVFATAEDKLHKRILQEKPQDVDAIKRKEKDTQGNQKNTQVNQKNDNETRFTEKQIEALKRVQGYVIIRAAQKKKFAFMNNLLEAPIEQQMMVCYLVENEKEETGGLPDVYTALYNYTPDHTKIAGKSLKKFSMAMRSTMPAVQFMDDLTDLETKMKQRKEQLEKDRDPVQGKDRTAEQKAEELANAIKEKGSLLVLLYRGAGMHVDMPPDMAADPVLRQRLFKEYREFGALVDELRKLGDAQEIKKADYELNNADKHEGEVKEDEDDSQKLETITKWSERVNNVSGAAFGYAGGAINSFGGLSQTITSSATYGFTASVTGGLSLLLGSALIVMNGINLIKDKDSSYTDWFAQWADLGGDVLNVVGGVVSLLGTLGSAVSAVTNSATAVAEAATAVAQTAADAVTTVTETATEGTKWLGVAENALWATGNTADKLALAGGAICMGAGLVKAGVAGVQLGRSVSSLVDINRSKSTLKTKDQTKITRDERMVKQFLDHQEKASMISAASSGVSIVAGTLGIIAGGFIISGYLAPIGALIGLGALTLDVAGKISNYFLKKANKKETVDQFLNLDAAVANIMAQPEGIDIKDYDKSTIRDLVREELLGSLGFSSYKACYKYLCTQFAEIMYNKVFLDTSVSTEDKEMYLNAMKSLGLHYKPAEKPGDPNKPTIQAMVSKMMG
ncbi:MAG: hypothetical protein K5668_03075 [Lachnospiraceae bacterium]|nr:hypothetical protein [Lachnospiraceae bacterium]